MIIVDDVAKYLNNNCYTYDKVLLRGQLEAIKIYCEARDYLALDIHIDVENKTQRFLIRLYYSELFKRKVSQKFLKNTVSRLVHRMLEFPNTYVIVNSLGTEGVIIELNDACSIWLPSGDWQLLPPIKESES